jgi:hypothetical protein
MQNAHPSRGMIATILLSCLALHVIAQTSAPSDGAGACATGHYRKFFAGLKHIPAQIDTKIDAAFKPLFQGDKSAQTIYYEVGSNANGPLTDITNTNHDTSHRGHVVSKPFCLHGWSHSH